MKPSPIIFFFVYFFSVFSLRYRWPLVLPKIFGFVGLAQLIHFDFLLMSCGFQDIRGQCPLMALFDETVSKRRKKFCNSVYTLVFTRSISGSWCRKYVFESAVIALLPFGHDSHSRPVYFYVFAYEIVVSTSYYLATSKQRNLLKRLIDFLPFLGESPTSSRLVFAPSSPLQCVLFFNLSRASVILRDLSFVGFWCFCLGQ